MTYKRGFSTLEITIVLLVFGVIVAILANVFSRSLDNQRLNEASENIVALLQKARGQTLASKDESGSGTGKTYAVHFDDKNSSPPNRAVIFIADGAGYAYNPSDSRNVVYALPVGIEIFGVRIPPNGPGVRPEVYFKRLTGEGQIRNASSVLVGINPYGIITLTSKKSGNSRVINISPSGVIQIE